MANLLRIADLANIIDNETVCQLKMSGFLYTYHPTDDTNICRAAGCIAGATCVAAYGAQEAILRFGSCEYEEEAARILDLSTAESHALFFPCHYAERTKEEAVDTLRRFAQTGKVMWPDCTHTDENGPCRYNRG